MNKILVTAFKCIISGVVFTICYFIITYVMGDKIDVVNIACIAIMYTIFTFILYIIAPHLRKVFGFKK